MNIHYVDRSRFECGFTCPRKRFWAYSYAGRGITPVADKPDLEYGLAVHNYIEAVFTKSKSLPHFDLADPELDALYEGHTRVFRDYVYPKILSEYDWVGSEVEIQMPLSPDIMWATRLDAILRRKSDGLWFVLEAKTSSHMDSLLRQSGHNFQLMMELESLRYWLVEAGHGAAGRGLVRQGMGSPIQIGGALLLVFDKGRKSAVKRDGQTIGYPGAQRQYRRMSPFTYVWTNGDTGEISLERPARYKGWELVPTWTTDNWLDYMAEHFPQEMKAQVQIWPSVSFDPDMVESVKRQVLGREKLIAACEGYLADMIGPEEVDEVWPQNFAACHNQFGKDCDYLGPCFSPTIGRDPVASGEFEWRTPNHPCEKVSDVG